MLVPGAATGSPVLPWVSNRVSPRVRGVLVSGLLHIPSRLSNWSSVLPCAGVFSVQKRVAPELSIRKKDLGDRSA